MNDSDKSEADNKDLVVVGSSAGGIGALSTLVSTLNNSFPAPIVLAQHLDPQRPSNLGSILERRSTLPVLLVTNTSQPNWRVAKFMSCPQTGTSKSMMGTYSSTQITLTGQNHPSICCCRARRCLIANISSLSFLRRRFGWRRGSRRC